MATVCIVKEIVNEAFTKSAILNNAASGFKVFRINHDIFSEEDFVVASFTHTILVANAQV